MEVVFFYSEVFLLYSWLMGDHKNYYCNSEDPFKTKTLYIKKSIRSFIWGENMPQRISLYKNKTSEFFWGLHCDYMHWWSFTRRNKQNIILNAESLGHVYQLVVRNPNVLLFPKLLFFSQYFSVSAIISHHGGLHWKVIFILHNL